MNNVTCKIKVNKMFRQFVAWNIDGFIFTYYSEWCINDMSCHHGETLYNTRKATLSLYVDESTGFANKCRDTALNICKIWGNLRKKFFLLQKAVPSKQVSG